MPPSATTSVERASREGGPPSRDGGPTPGRLGLAVLAAGLGVALVVTGIWLFNRAEVLAVQWAPREAEMSRIGWALRSGSVGVIAAGQVLFALLVVPGLFRRGALEQVWAVSAGVVLVLAGVTAAALWAAAL